MNTDTFWGLIEQHLQAGDDGEIDVEPLTEALAAMPAPEIAGFDLELQRCLRAAYSWRLWGAGYLVLGSCGDDSFEYFRCWLVAQGRSVFAAALADVESLASLDWPEVPELEELLYVAADAYERAGHGELPVDPTPLPDLGEQVDFDDDAAMKKRYPRLWAAVEG